MQKHKKLSARILSIALSVAMVTTMLPATVFAAVGDVLLGASPIGEIKSFDKLEDRFIPSTGKNAPDYVYGLSVALNTPVEDLNLPNELTAMVARTTTVTEDEPTVDSGNQPASPSDAEEEVKDKAAEIKDDDVPLAPEPDQDEETTITTIESESIPVEWNSHKEYKSDENGKFIYTAVLPEGYILANGVKLPQIYVAVGKQSRASDSIYEVGPDGDYTTLSEAMADGFNVRPKTTLKLISDITESGINNDDSIRINIDLNGHTLKGDGTEPLFTDKLSAYIMNTGSTGGTLDINGQDLTDYDVPTRTGADCYMSTSSADKSITIKNSGSGGTLSLPSFVINEKSYVILDQSVTLENPGYPGTKLGLNLTLSKSTLINNGTIKTESRGGIVGTVKNGATGKIYIGAGLVDSIDNTTPGGKVYVTGGSIKSIMETGNEGNVYFGESETTPAVQYTLTLNNGTADLGNNIYVNGLTTTPAYTYGMDGVRTSNTGKLYIWVPSGLARVNATVPSTAGADAGTYVNSAISGAAATLTKSVEPAVSVGAQNGTLTYGKTDTATFAVTVSNFAFDPRDYSLAWFSDAEGKTATTEPNIDLSFSDDLKTLIFAPGTADAGDYYFKLTAGSDSETAVSEVITMTVDKGVYSGTASKEVGIMINKTEEQSGTLSAADFFTETPADAKITTISAKSTGNNILKGTPSLNSSGGLDYASNTNLIKKDVSDTYDITIQSKNYKDIHVELSFKTINKMSINISGLTAPTERKYNGTAMENSDFGTPSYSPAWSGTLEYTYYEGSGTSGMILESAPKNAGSYTVVAKIPDSDTIYAGKMELKFTIAKADITIMADNKSAYVGDAKPLLTYNATGLASGDTLATAPTLTYESEPDMSKAGSVKIKASGAVVPNTDNYESTITYVDGTLTIRTKSSGGGGSSSSQTIYTSVPTAYQGGTKIIGNVRVPDYTVEGTWKKNENGTWTFTGNGGQTYANTWAPVFNPYANVIKGQSAFDWFMFDANGNMMTGWYTDVNGNTYYLNPNSDNTLGAMQTGWVTIDGKRYYFNENPDGTRGKLFRNTRTPDGYLVDENGVWDGSEKQ